MTPDRPEVVVFTTRWCPFCRAAKDLLRRRGVSFREVDLTDRPDFRDELVRVSGRRTVPQILVGGRPIGGYEDLRVLEESGQLGRLFSI